MKPKEIREMTRQEIEQRIAENEAQLQAWTFQHAIAQLEDPTVMRKTRREIARLKTILHEQATS